MRDRSYIEAAALVCLLAMNPAVIRAQAYSGVNDPAIVLADDPANTVVDEAWLSAGLARPFLEGPQTVGALWRAAYSVAESNQGSHTAVLDTMAELFSVPRGAIDYSASVFLSGGWDDSPDRSKLYSSAGQVFIDPLLSENIMDRDPFLDLRLLLRASPLAVDINPDLRPSTNVYRSDDALWTNASVVSNPERVNVNFPDRGIASVLAGAFEFRLGRDKLQLGPGRRSSLGVGYNLPWLDYGSAKADFGPLDLSWYVIRLNPTITPTEEQYLLSIRDDPSLQLEQNAGYQLQGIERSKHLVASRYTIRPAGWLVFALTQYHLVGGRSLQLSDANPLIIFHNIFQEGVYSVPATAEFSAVPLPGLELYGQYMLYDATVADEVGSGTTSAGAAAWQLGLTALSTPWFDSGPGRFRLDMEFSKADPWIYGKYISWRQFTSRYILVEPFAGRFWIDYPIGFYLGPDALEAWASLSYGDPAKSELTLEASYSIRGSVDFYGYGPDTDYANKETFIDSGLVVVKVGEVPEKRFHGALRYDFRPGSGKATGRSGPSAGLGAALNIVEGYGFTPGDDRLWGECSVSLGWSF